MLIIAGLPLMFMELSFGQYAALGPVAIYQRFCPLLKGLGYGMIIVSAIVMLYYNVIIAWTIFYMFASLQFQLPWQNCEPEWSTKRMENKLFTSSISLLFKFENLLTDCYSYEAADRCETINGTFFLRTCYNASETIDRNLTNLAVNVLKRPPAEEYFT